MVQIITTPLVGSGIKDFYITEGNRFVYVVTSGGVDVIELINTCAIVASGILPNEPTCIAVDFQSARGQLYIGTKDGGIFAMNYGAARKGDFTDELVQRFTTTTSPPVSDNQINDLDTLPGRLLIGTGAGVDFISNETEFSTRSLISGSLDVHLTTGGAGYWTTISGDRGSVETNYDLLSTTGTSIIGIDFEYSSISDPSLPAEPPVDIAISELSGNLPVLAFATPSGVLITEETQFSEDTARRKTILSEEVSSVDFADDSAFNIGTVYVLVTGTVGLQIFDLGTDIIIATHPQKGTATRGQFVASGTNTLIRTTSIT